MILNARQADDRRILRDLAARVAAIAALDVQDEKRDLWRRLNRLEPVRPMVAIDQICWNEFAACPELALQCTDPECREYETYFRRVLYQWNHFPVDMVVDPCVTVAKAVINTGFGMQIRERTAVTDPTSSIVGHQYENQFQTEADIEKIRMATVSHDEAETERRLALAHTLFDGVMEVRLTGYDPGYLTFWDPLSMWMGVENALYTMIDHPDLIHGILERMTASALNMLDQLEAQGLLCGPQPWVHCSGAWTDSLPAPGYDPEHPRTRDLWMFGMAQLFSTVSPEMHRVFELDYVRRLCARFGQVYYGCCEPLDDKLDEIRTLPNLRKISMSPWANLDRGARGIGGDFVFSRKPNPAMVATDRFDPDAIRADLLETRQICDRHGCPLEFILKDISTVHYEPTRLDQWAAIAMDVAGAGESSYA